MIKNMNTNRILTLVLSFVAVALFSIKASAQELVPPQGYVYVDSLVYVPNVSIDSTLVNKDVFNDMPSEALGDAATVTVGQSELIEQSMRKHIETNPARTISGYRVRIFFDNKQTARNESEQTVSRFRELYGDIAVYRTYTQHCRSWCRDGHWRLFQDNQLPSLRLRLHWPQFYPSLIPPYPRYS